MSSLNRKWTDGMLRTEDWWAVWLGLIMFFAGLLTIWGIDIVGWMAKTKTWEWTNLTSDFSWDKLLKSSTETGGNFQTSKTRSTIVFHDAYWLECALGSGRFQVLWRK